MSIYASMVLGVVILSIVHEWIVTKLNHALWIF